MGIIVVESDDTKLAHIADVKPPWNVTRLQITSHDVSAEVGFKACHLVLEKCFGVLSYIL